MSLTEQSRSESGRRRSFRRTGRIENPLAGELGCCELSEKGCPLVLQYKELLLTTIELGTVLVLGS